MSEEGEFKKRIEKQKQSLDGELNMIGLFRHNDMLNALLTFEQWVDEATKEFPFIPERYKLDAWDSHNLLDELCKWRKKWLPHG